MGINVETSCVAEMSTFPSIMKTCYRPARCCVYPHSYRIYLKMIFS